MTPRLARLLLCCVVAVALTGGVVAWAATTDPGRDPAPPPATGDVPGVVSIARLVTPPVAVASTPRGSIELRITEPDGTRRAVLTFRETRTRTGRRVDRQCWSAGPEARLRRLETAFGNCRERTSPDPWAITVGASSGGSVTLAGVASGRVARLTVAGPGGTFVVPVSRGGAFMVVYGRRASGRAVLTATLDDGTTRFFRTEVPPTFRPAGAVVVPDPAGLPSWYAGASSRDRGPRNGQTCAQVAQDNSIRARGRNAGGTLLAPVCGVLARSPIFARTTTIGPTERLGTFGGGRNVPRRTVLVGAARRDVREVALRAPAGRQTLVLADAGRAFLAVLPATVSSAQLTLEVTLDDGTVQRFVDPVAVNRATTERPPPRLVGRPVLRIDPPGSRRAVLELRLSTTARRARATLLGREVRLRRVGTTTTYRGVYDGTRGAQRRLARPGALQRYTLLLCGDVCGTQLQRVRVR